MLSSVCYESSGSMVDTPLEILNKRYAKGEIDKADTPLIMLTKIPQNHKKRFKYNTDAASSPAYRRAIPWLLNQILSASQ
jgi:hypothetical protein